MHESIVKSFLSKEVEVTTNTSSFKGIISEHTFDVPVPEKYVTIAPTMGYIAKKYGPVTIQIDAIITIREVIPFLKEKYNMNDGDDFVELVGDTKSYSVPAMPVKDDGDSESGS